MYGVGVGCRVRGAGCRDYGVHRRERLEHDSGELLSEGGRAEGFRVGGSLGRLLVEG